MIGCFSLVETIHQELSLSSSGVNQPQKLRTLSRLVAKKCKQLLERGNPPASRQGARGFSFLHPGVLLYCTLFPFAPNKKHILHFKLPKVISIQVLVSATQEQTAPELSLLSRFVFPYPALHGSFRSPTQVFSLLQSR